MNCRHCRKDINSASGEFCPHCGMAVTQPTKSDTYFADQEHEPQWGWFWLASIPVVVLTLLMLSFLKSTSPGTFGRWVVVFLSAVLPLLYGSFGVRIMRSARKYRDLPLIKRAVTVHEKWAEAVPGEKSITVLGDDVTPVEYYNNHVVFASPDREYMQFNRMKQESFNELEEGDHVVLQYKGTGPHYRYYKHEHLQRGV